MKHLMIFLLSILTITTVTAQHRGLTMAQARSNSLIEPSDNFARKGFVIQAEIPFNDEISNAFYAGGSIDTRLSYFDLSIGGSLTTKDVLFRIEYGMNVLYLIDEKTNKLCLSIGAGVIVGLHAEDWNTSPYEWFFKAPFFVGGLKYHFSRYSITLGWKQDYGVFEKFKEGKEVSQDYLKKGCLFVKFCVY